MRRLVLLAALALGACQTAAVPPPPRFAALGTEPFWGIDVEEGQLRYSSPEVPDGKAFPASAAREGQAWRFTGTLDGKAVRLTIKPGTCSDGMSDTDYSYEAVFTWGDRTEQGCARLR